MMELGRRDTEEKDRKEKLETSREKERSEMQAECDRKIKEAEDQIHQQYMKMMDKERAKSKELEAHIADYNRTNKQLMLRSDTHHQSAINYQKTLEEARNKAARYKHEATLARQAAAKLTTENTNQIKKMAAMALKRDEYQGRWEKQATLIKEAKVALKEKEERERAMRRLAEEDRAKTLQVAVLKKGLAAQRLLVQRKTRMIRMLRQQLCRIRAGLSRSTPAPDALTPIRANKEAAPLPMEEAPLKPQPGQPIQSTSRPPPNLPTITMSKSDSEKTPLSPLSALLQISLSSPTTPTTQSLTTPVTSPTPVLPPEATSSTLDFLDLSVDTERCKDGHCASPTKTRESTPVSDTELLLAPSPEEKKPE
jgi:hypothetical protein